jgi:aminopeptidase N
LGPLRPARPSACRPIRRDGKSDADLPHADLHRGDKSLVGLVAHELAHSWSGNLVTNSNWADSWLNEGVTSYFENRIMEAIYGPKRATQEASLSFDEWKKLLLKSTTDQTRSSSRPKEGVPTGAQRDHL